MTRALNAGRPMRALLSFAISAVLLGLGAAAPAVVGAACGAVPDEGWLARYAGRHADTIVLGRFTREDDEGNVFFTTLEIYRGEATSPIINGWPESLGIRDIGGCTNQRVEPGQRFVYAEGDRARAGRMQLIFPHVQDRGFVVSHWGEYRSLTALLGLLGVLPDTAAAETAGPANDHVDLGFVVLLAALSAFLLMLFRPSRLRPNS